MADNNLREYLIRLGFDVDHASLNDMRTAVREGAFQAGVLFEALKGVVQQIAQTTGAIAEHLNSLRALSHIYNESAGSLEAFTEASEERTVYQENALSPFPAFARAVRTDPWARGLALHFTGLSENSAIT